MVAESGGLTAATAPAFMAQVRAMSSSYDQRRVLTAVSANSSLADAVGVEAIRAVGVITQLVRSIDDAHQPGRPWRPDRCLGAGLLRIGIGDQLIARLVARPPQSCGAPVSQRSDHRGGPARGAEGQQQPRARQRPRSTSPRAANYRRRRGSCISRRAMALAITTRIERWLHSSALKADARKQSAVFSIRHHNLARWGVDEERRGIVFLRAEFLAPGRRLRRAIVRLSRCPRTGRDAHVAVVARLLHYCRHHRAGVMRRRRCP